MRSPPRAFFSALLHVSPISCVARGLRCRQVATCRPSKIAVGGRLVAKALPRQTVDVSKFHTMADRAWFAYQCLPRDKKGSPPSIRGLEEKYGLSHASLNKLFWGWTDEPSYAQLKRFCAALQVSVDWLHDGAGVGPYTNMPVPPRPEAPERKRSGATTVSGAELSVGVEATFKRKAKKLANPRKPSGSRRTSN